MKKVSLSQITPVPTSHNADILKKIIAKKGDIPHIVQIAQATLNPGDVIEEHKHNDLYEIFYIESGEGIAIVNGVEHAVTVGDIITVEPQDIHKFQNGSQKSLTMYYFGLEINSR